MNFSALCAEVYSLTGRPDRVAETEAAVKAATLKTHQSDFYYKDLFETGVVFDSADYIQTLEYRSIVPTWRALKYLRKYDTVSQLAGAFLDVVDPTDVLDAYKYQRQDICYVAGSNLQINSSTQESTYILGCYLNPNITAAGFSSWIAEDHPYAIIYDAAATVFKSIGKDEESATYRQLVADQINAIRISNLSMKGY
jgi:hypothetical protein